MKNSIGDFDVKLEMNIIRDAIGTSEFSSEFVSPKRLKNKPTYLLFYNRDDNIYSN